MATVLSHAVAATAIGAAFSKPKTARFWIYGAVLSMVPDIDVLGFGFGIRYGDMLGHRGFTHSLIFALLASGCATLLILSRDVWLQEKIAMSGQKVWLYFFLATASHGLLDAMINGGLGVGFFIPFNATRYFFPFHPIEVSPIGAAFLSPRGIAVLKNEALWIWLPSAVLFAATFFASRGRQEAAQRSTKRFP